MLPEWSYKKLLLQGKRKRMTLIAGAFCADGLWVIGDREESGIGGKRSVRKIFRETEPKGKWVLVIATAGRSSLADLAVRRISLSAREKPSVFVKKHEAAINSILEEIWDTHIRKKKSLSDREKRLREFDLIVGIREVSSRSLYLYKTDEDILQFQSTHACAGGGEELGNYLLDRLGNPGFHAPTLTRDQMLDLLLFVLREAKNSVDGVGQETEGFFLPFQGSISEWHWRTPLTDLQLPSLSESMNHFWLTPSESRRSKGQ